LLVVDLAISVVVLLGIALVAEAGRRRPRAAAFALLVIAAADLYRVNGQLLPTVAWGELWREPPAMAVMRRGDDPLRIYSDAVGRAPVPSFPDVFLQDQNLLLFEVANYYDIANLNAPSSINLRDHERFAELIEEVAPERVAPLLAAFNTAYVTSPKDLHRYPGLTTLRSPQSSVDAYVNRVEAMAPRAFVARRLQPVAGDDEALAYLANGDDPAVRVAVDGAAVPPDLPAETDGSVRLSAYRADEVELEATLRTPALVVLTDTFYPGWEATVDGVPAPIVRANYFARGVFAPAGAQRITFRYRPWSYRFGLLMSLSACMVALVSVLWWRPSASARRAPGAGAGAESPTT
jgi:hypothetical protein